MASLFDPTSAPQSDQPSAPQGAPDTTQAASGWRDWIGRPDNRAALMQFGIAMMQPVAPGQSQLGHVASAVGSGGEAAARVGRQSLLEQEASSKQDLRAAQANAAESRAYAAGARNDASASRLELARDRLAQQDQQNRTLSYLRSMNQWNAESKAYNNQRVLNPAMPEFPSFEDWSRSRGLPTPLPSPGGSPAPGVNPQDVERVRAALAATPNDPQVQELANRMRAAGVQI